jgi:hypothetical protein
MSEAHTPCRSSMIHTPPDSNLSIAVAGLVAVLDTIAVSYIFWNVSPLIELHWATPACKSYARDRLLDDNQCRCQHKR